MPVVFFDFQLQVFQIVELVQQILERRDTDLSGPGAGVAACIHGRQFGGGVVANAAFVTGGAVNGKVMHQHGDTVFRQHQVQLKVTNSVPVGVPETGQGVLGSLSFRSPVSVDDHSCVLSFSRW